MMKKQKIFSDITLNILAAGIVAVVTQFAVYPLIGKGFNSLNFGNILVMMSVVNIIAVVLGNSLNNIRLIHEKDYEKEKIKGDFPQLLVLGLGVNIFLVSLFIFMIWPDEPVINSITLVLVSIFTMLRAYLTVEYRLQLNYKKIVIHSSIYSLSLLLGTLILFHTDIWPLVFLVGEIISFFYLNFTTKLLKEKIIFTNKFRLIFKQYFLLCTSSVIGNVLIYLDRIIILTFLGPLSVTIYFTATIIGKMTSFVISPISGVILSYLSSKEGSLSLKEFGLINLGMIFISSIMTALSYIISAPLLKVLYPDVYEEAISILFFGNLGVILQTASMIPQTILLKYGGSSYQVAIQITYGIVYVIGGIIMMINFGLLGFCIAAIIAALFKFIIISLIGLKVLK